MTTGEELLLLLELNGFDITKYRLKKQLEYEKSGNFNLFKFKKFSDLVVSNYNYTPDKDYFHRNPLTYNESWEDETFTIDQFYVSHPDLPENITLGEFLEISTLSEVSKESILYDILDEWVEEYREASIIQMENLREMISLLPKKNNKYRKPSRIAFILSLLFTLTLVLIYKNPGLLQPAIFPFIGRLVNDYHALLYESSFYSFLGVFTILILSIYVIASNLITRLIKDARLEKNKRILAIFDKWDKDIKDLRIDQSGYLEDYVDAVMQNPKITLLEIKQLGEPEKLLKKFKDYVRLVENRFDWTKKNYAKMSRILKILFSVAALFNLLFYIVGFALMRGFI